MGTSKIWVMLSALVGAGAALMTTAAVQSVKETDQQAIRRQTTDTLKYTRTNKSVMVQASLGRLEALEQEVARLRHGHAEHSMGSEHDESLAAEILNPEEERMRVEARFAELERHVSVDPVDPSWSSQATESLRNDLSELARTEGFNLVAAECRTDICRATLRWDNYEAAVKTGMHLPERAIPGLNCAKSIWLKEPDNPAGSYSSNLFLDCSEQRAGNADIIPPSTTTGEVP